MKLIQTTNYLLLIDEVAEIKENTWYENNGVLFLSDEKYDGGNNPNNSNPIITNYNNSVIAYLPLTKEAKELDLPLLPKPFKEVDFDNKSELKILLEKRAEESNTCDLNEYALGLLAGYKAAQSKQFSLEDVKKAIEMAREEDGWSDNTMEYSHTEEEIIKSLSTQQSPISFEPEYEYQLPDGTWSLLLNTRRKSVYKHNLAIRLKIITNSEGKEEIQGTYKY